MTMYYFMNEDVEVDGLNCWKIDKFVEWKHLEQTKKYVLAFPRIRDKS